MDYVFKMSIVLMMMMMMMTRSRTEVAPSRGGRIAVRRVADVSK